MNSTIRHIFIAFALIWAIGSAQAGLLLRESFDYPVDGRLDDVGSGTGWDTNKWTATANGGPFIEAGSLSFPDGVGLFPGGNSIRSSTTAVNRQSVRLFETAINLGTTYYASFLMRRDEGGSFRIETSNATQIRLGVGVDADGTLWTRRFGTTGLSSTASGTVKKDTVYFVLVKQTGSTVRAALFEVGKDTVPEDESGITWLTHSSSASGVDQDRLIITIGGSAVTVLDELRLGTTFESVTVDPEPPPEPPDPDGPVVDGWIQNGQFTLSWADTTGKLWTVWSTTNLLTGFDPVAVDLATPGYTIDAEDPVRFFRLSAREGTVPPPSLPILDGFGAGQGSWTVRDADGVVVFEEGVMKISPASSQAAASYLSFEPIDLQDGERLRLTVDVSTTRPDASSGGIRVGLGFADRLIGTSTERAVPLAGYHKAVPSGGSTANVTVRWVEEQEEDVRFFDVGTALTGNLANTKTVGTEPVELVFEIMRSGESLIFSGSLDKTPYTTTTVASGADVLQDFRFNTIGLAYAFGQNHTATYENLRLQKFGTILNEYHPALEWEVDESMEEVRIQIATDSDFHQILVDDRVHSFVPRFVPGDPLEPGEYWWRISAQDKMTGVWGGWSDTEQFTIEHNPTVLVPLGSSYAEIQAIVNGSANNTRILFEHGVYTFDLEEIGDSSWFIDLSNKSNVVIDGNGSSIVFEGRVTNGFARVAGLSGCQDITIRNFDIHRTYPLALPLEIIEVNTNNASFVCRRVNDSYPLPAEDPFQYVGLQQSGLDYGFVLDKDSRKVKFGTPLTLFNDPDQSGPVDEERWRYTLYEVRPGHREYIHNLQPGDIYVKDNKSGPGVRTIYAVRAKNLTISNVNSFDATPNMNYHFEKCDLVKIIGCDFLSDGYVGLVSDALHFKDLRSGAWIEGNTLERNGDDGWAIHPMIRSSAFVRIDASTVEVSHLDDVQVGDVLHFFRNESSSHYAAEASVVSMQTGGGKHTLTLDEPVVTTDITSYINYNLAGPGTMIRGNVMRHVRGDPFHVTLDGAVFENNVLSDIGERAFTFTPTPGGGSYSRNILIRNNTFSNMSRSDRIVTHGAFLMIYNSSSAPLLHRNIHFVDNTCYGYKGSAVEIQQARDVYITGNHFSSGTYHDLGDDGQKMIRLANTESVFFRDNRFTEHRNRPPQDLLDLVNATGWSVDNPDFEEQVEMNPWNLSKINHDETGNAFFRGTARPARSLTKIRLVGSGTMSGGAASDKCTFAHVSFPGDGQLRLKVEGLSVPAGTDFARGGLMIRETTDPSSKMVMLAIREYDGEFYVQSLSRAATAGGLVSNEMVPLDRFPVYLRLERDGDLVQGSYSYDEAVWHTLQSLPIPMNTMIQGGVAVTSQAVGELTTLHGDELLVQYNGLN